ncbi:MAG TPA: hypothetical protein PLJ38_03860 [bacterium]|nr:hypothetical protein [bacterium]
MDIIINKEKLSFELSGSENCKAIIDDLRNWLLQRKHILLKTHINDENYDKQKHDNLGIADIKRIEVESEHIEILTINSIGELKNYSDRVEFYVRKIKEENAAYSDDKILEIYMQVKDGFSWCLKAVENISKVLTIDNNEEWKEKYLQLKEKLDDIECIFDGARARELFLGDKIEKVNHILIVAILFLFEELKKKKTLLSFDEILEKIEASNKELETVKTELPLIAEKLQVGESVEAMNILKERFGILESIVNFYYQIQCSISIEYDKLMIKEKSMQDYLNDYLKLLKDLLDAMETKDYVMLADLLEYELSEFISVFIESFVKIKDITSNLKKSISVNND